MPHKEAEKGRKRASVRTITRPIQTKEFKPNARDVPMTGRVGEARNAIAGRRRQIDDAVEEMERGTLQNARRPRSY